MFVMINVMTWNMRRSASDSKSWEVIRKVSPEICLLQEVGGIPNKILNEYQTLQQKATNKKGIPQKFSTVILSKEPLEQFRLKSSIEWVSNQLDFFSGNFLSASTIINHKKISLISVYAPAWIVDTEDIDHKDLKGIKLELSKDIWPTEILQKGLENEKISIENNWIISGDFNNSSTFDILWPGGPKGCQEIIDRLYSLNLKEALFEHHGKLVPTFRNPKGGKIIHQIDHVFLSEGLFANLNSSIVLDDIGVFEDSLSDHLPILTIIK